ncbi:VOC family protein [Neobacillus niacini]|uniref:VOC family protein n=1 Tax=Neobacillus niacini TaxID=86668 RepID=UPI002FFF39DD
MVNPHFLSQLAHVELLSPKPEETVNYLKEVWGLEETTRTGQSVYLRAWGDYFHHSLKITEAAGPGLGHIGWRADSQGALENVVQHLERTELGKGWIDGDLGHGKAYQFITPGGHLSEVFWDVEWYQAPEGKESVWKNRPQKQVRRGIGVRRLDHVTVLTDNTTVDRLFYQDLGIRYNEGIYSDFGDEIGAWMSVSNLSHDIAFINAGFKGGFHHVCFAVESREELLNAADTIREHGFEIESGPGKHAVAEGLNLYAIEPGGNRIELYAGAHLVFAPDWGPKKWKVSENPNDAWSTFNLFNPDGSLKYS